MNLLGAFKNKNGELPKHIVVYRDGVSDSQFEQVMMYEVEAFKEALKLLGDLDTGEVKLSFIICQKNHHTRLAFDERGTYLNICPGVVADASGGPNSISSTVLNEFYLNSHVAIQGTCKPCKYTLLYDEINFKLSELELLTYWSCYLYSRCNRSVSLATPAYYAHWAAQRARNLCSAGALASDLQQISDTWSTPGRHSCMFFL